ncbi:MAG: glucosaminidase domain-containing protein, partial [Alphaproteobacteria bacterium]|nr:glucosaminidase domain-containing protein [Alphaproteobacteria bacterium]
GLTVSQKKSLFFRALLPMVLMTNREILADRARLRGIRGDIAARRTVSPENADWVRDLARRYGLSSLATGSEPPNGRSLDLLLRRVDAIPPSLALAQAAVESAYGSSRFAVEGNALFGQWRFGDGLVPGRQRTRLGDYRIADFDSPMGSIRAYARNLNTNPAYKPFRDRRAVARQGGRTPEGAVLAGGLLAYSEKGQQYVDLLRNVIARNRLSVLDMAKLAPSSTRRIVTGVL